jgi:hypothetical protein
MTGKENFMKVIDGETPGWVPRYYGSVAPYSSFKPACLSVSPSPLTGTPLPAGRKDIFGVEFVATAFRKLDHFYNPKTKAVLGLRRSFDYEQYTYR